MNSKANGSIYVAAVFAVLGGFFTYHWWFNPMRAVKYRLGEVAAALSVPANEPDLARVERIGQLRQYLAPDVRIEIGGAEPLTSRDAVAALVGSFHPAATPFDVQFVDTQVTVTGDEGVAMLTAEVTTPDRQTGQPTVDSRVARVVLQKRDGDWVITTAESKAPPPRP
jgi:hypothetical protein